MSRVVHCQKAHYDIYVGRATGERGRFGNPFIIGIHGTRAEVVAMYEGWLRTGNSYTVAEATEERRRDILHHLPSLRGKVLGCWCGPKAACHGHVLLALLGEANLHQVAINAPEHGVKHPIPAAREERQIDAATGGGQ